MCLHGRLRRSFVEVWRSIGRRLSSYFGRVPVVSCAFLFSYPIRPVSEFKTGLLWERVESENSENCINCNGDSWSYCSFPEQRYCIQKTSCEVCFFGPYSNSTNVYVVEAYVSISHLYVSQPWYINKYRQYTFESIITSWQAATRVTFAHWDWRPIINIYNLCVCVCVLVKRCTKNIWCSKQETSASVHLE